MKTHLTSQIKINEAIKELASIEPNGAYEVHIKRLPQTRTSKQNRAVHKYFTMVSDQLKETYTVQQVLKEAIEREWTPEAVKELIWKPVQEAVTGKDSTAKAHREEYSKVYQCVSHHLSTNFGINVPFPSIEEV